MIRRLGWLFSFVFALTSWVQAQDEAGFESLFDGKTLTNWDGNPEFWSVRDEAITGQTTPEKPTKGNTFIIYRKATVSDFELRLKFKIVGGNSGVQYRSEEVSPWVIKGYQADFDGAGGWTGTLYEEKGRGILAKRGNKVQITADGKKAGTEIAKEADILAAVKQDDWNDYTIIADGNHLIHKVNGVTTIDVTDDEAAKRRMSGLLALQLHAGPPMTVQFKNIRLKKLASPVLKSSALKNDGEKKRIVFVAGRPSHGYGAHEHNAGCLLLARELQRAKPGYEVVVHRNGWPTEANAFAGADTIVMYCDGGGGHMVNPNLEQVDALTKKGVGVVCIHYAVEVPKGPSGDKFLDWIGGYFEMNWSVNPHWTARFEKLPVHPITRGVKPFAINDEWYYHMRFRPEMKGVTPILSALAGPDTLTRKDGPHSGNPYVRESVAKGEMQHVGWASERPDGGRGFGFTGGHDHWNWGHPDFRKTVLNAIVWTAKGEVPAEGVEVAPVSAEDLEANPDYPRPANYNREIIQQRMVNEEPKKVSAVTPTAAPIAGSANAAELFNSSVVTPSTPGHAIDINVELKGAKQLALVVTDAGNGFTADWADWVEPRLTGAKGELKLTDLKWAAARAGWGQVNVNANCDGGPLRIAGKSVAYGIGTHSNSVIVFNVPEGYDRFVARAGLDNGGTDQGSASSVQFLVYNAAPAQLTTPSANNAPPAASHEAKDAIAGLNVAEGAEATLFASEPMTLNLTNLDIDHRGRIWVCEVMNYRRHNGTRKEGDRILILEDTNGDGKADKSTVFYQGVDINSAIGLCVLGNQVIVSCSPNIFVFTDTDGDDKPDRKELLFTNVGDAQHDHSAHSFLFGPDGKLYWNFGNTGKRVCDKDGKPVVDLAGNMVSDGGKPYWGGMPFRCNADGGDFETLAHNFRNNYEVAVDSFGTLWQSDNDDDGNRGVRINFVMEYGNYGYRQEFTGSGWRTPRENIEGEVPLMHWHLNDPGVVPNLLQTGAGSPTGILVYEGRSLPKVFWDQVIHCDAGPSVVRAYPAKKYGAGYTAGSVDLLQGARDNWFRPADVCVAPDGSVFVSDWYDPGVGGHNQQDLDRGRLFRVASTGLKYTVPKYDFENLGGAIAALQNPCNSVRYLAWTALHKLHAQGQAVVPALTKLADETDSPRMKARALWCLGKIAGQGPAVVAKAITDRDADIRTVGIRLARQLKLDVASLASLAQDPAPEVRRELAIALHLSTSPAVPQIWATLAAQHDGDDRWYLEALGIGAARHWDECLDAYLAKVNEPLGTRGGRDIIWRSRGKKTPQLLAAAIRNPATSEGDLPRYFRAFDLYQGDKNAALQSLLDIPAGGNSAALQTSVAKALLRLSNVNVADAPRVKSAVLGYLDRLAPGSDDYLALVDRAGLKEKRNDLVQIILTTADDTAAVRVAGMLLKFGEQESLQQLMQDKDENKAARVARAVGYAGGAKLNTWFEPLVTDTNRPLGVRSAAVQALGRNKVGEKFLVELVTSEKLPADLKFAAANVLLVSNDATVRAAAGKHLQLPSGVDKKPLPPLTELVKQKGDANRGKQLFATTGTCAKCHKVRGEGKDVGPDLSEIGSKLSKEAMFVSILDPSAGISHNYESYILALDDGTTLTGVKVSETAADVTIKNAESIVRTVARKNIEQMEKSKLSIMPADIQKALNAQNLVDIVEYMTSLKK